LLFVFAGSPCNLLPETLNQVQRDDKYDKSEIADLIRNLARLSFKDCIIAIPAFAGMAYLR
jgi:hypothetical protein